MGHSLNLSVLGSYRVEGLDAPPSSEVLGSVFHGKWSLVVFQRGLTCPCPPGPCTEACSPLGRM